MTVAAIGAVVLAGCGSAARPTPRPVARPAEPAWGTPALASRSAVIAAITDYSKRNNALIPKSVKPPYPRDIYTPVDTGVTLLGDPYQIAWAAADPKIRATVKPYVYDTPTAIYLPASTSWPKAVGVAVTTHVVGAKPAKVGAMVPLTVFEQKVRGGALLNAVSLSVRRAALPKPLAIGADTRVPATERARALRLARALMTHWERRTKGVAGFSSISGLDATLRGWSSDRYQTMSWSPRLLAGETGLRTLRAQGGTLVLASYRVVTRIVAAPGARVNWNGPFALVFGGDKRKTQTLKSVSVAAWFMPTKGGAVPLGSRDLPTLD